MLYDRVEQADKAEKTIDSVIDLYRSEYMTPAASLIALPRLSPWWWATLNPDRICFPTTMHREAGLPSALIVQGGRFLQPRRAAVCASCVLTRAERIPEPISQRCKLILWYRAMWVSISQSSRLTLLFLTPVPRLRAAQLGRIFPQPICHASGHRGRFAVVTVITPVDGKSKRNLRRLFGMANASAGGQGQPFFSGPDKTCSLRLARHVSSQFAGSGAGCGLRHGKEIRYRFQRDSFFQNA